MDDHRLGMLRSVASCLALVVLTLATLVLAPASTGAATTTSLAPITTVMPPNFGLPDIVFYGTPFGKPTVYVAEGVIDAVNAKTDALIGSFGQGDLQSSTVPSCGALGGRGPDGVLSLTVGGSNQVFVGNGNSTLQEYTLSSPGSGKLAKTIDTGGQCRADEMAYDPVDHLILIANPGESTPFATFVSVHSNPSKDQVVGKISFPGAVGLEQSVYDPKTGRFYLNVPQTTATNPDLGAVAVINPKSKKQIGSFPITGCNSTGLALDPANQEALIGCSAGHGEMIMNMHDGAIVHALSSLPNCDQVAFDQSTGDFLAPGIGGPLSVISARSGKVLSQTTVDGVTHSAAAGDGKVFVALVSNGIEIFHAH
ncbi:MAG TPA: hypothetical protein VGI44_14475 [Acidimicrobiales bacterium]